MTLTIAIGHDHAGQPLREAAISATKAAGHIPLVASHDSIEPTDYPDVAAAVGEAIARGRAQRGLLICGSGAGVTVAANNHPHVRAALAHEGYTARQMVEHDDVNVLAIGARVVGPRLAAEVIRVFLQAAFSGEERHARRLAKVLDQRRRMHRNALRELVDAGQGVWLDSISSALIDEGRLARYIAELFVTGVTSNPSILEEVIASSDDDYDDRIRALGAERARVPEDLAFALALSDLTKAADLLLPTFHATRGFDGFVSIEVSPGSVDDERATVAMGKKLHRLAKRPNVMIKVPGTAAGLRATEELLVDGIPVNVTLLFSPRHHAETSEAYLRAMERRLEQGRAPRVASVASMFVSRWDAAVDDLLPEPHRGKLGLALMQETFSAYRNTLESPRFRRLENEGALAQRLLFASTSPKDPSLPEGYYLGRLAAPGTVDTVPEATLLAYAEHGVRCELLEPDPEGAREAIAAAEAASVDVEALADQLRNDGTASFAAAWERLLASIREKLDR